MRTLHVIPFEGIGLLKLGMSPEQILDAITEEWSNLNLFGNNNIQISKDTEDDGYSLRYIKGSFFFMVYYINDRAVEISVDREMSNRMNVVLYDVDVFNTPAEEVINSVRHFSKYSYDAEDELLSTNYVFNDIGIRLWREEAFHEKLLSDKAYMEKMSMIIEEMYRYLYFDIITVRKQAGN